MDGFIILSLEFAAAHHLLIGMCELNVCVCVSVCWQQDELD